LSNGPLLSRRRLSGPTVRDVYHDLLGWHGDSHGYNKGEKLKRRVYRLLSKMRRYSMVGFEELNDDSSDSLGVRTFTDSPHFWRDVNRRVDSYYKDLTKSQPKRVKVFTEGAGTVRQFYEVAKDYTIPVYSPGGWDSLNFKYETANCAAREYEQTGQQTVVLHAGDFDPDGVELFRVFTEDVWAFVEADLGEEPEEVITFKRVMLHADQVPDNKRRYLATTSQRPTITGQAVALRLQSRATGSQPPRALGGHATRH
jgi:hypothetical protein